MIFGKNPRLLRATYIRPNPKNDIEESFEVVWLDDGDDIHVTYEPPDATIYFTKHGFRNHSYNKPVERLEKLEAKTCKINDIRNEIAKDIGDEGLEFISQCFRSRDYKSLDKLFSWRYSYRADMQPEFYLMDAWYKKFPNISTSGIRKGFIDIELDMLQDDVDLDNLSNGAFARVNLITVFIEHTKECYTFVLAPVKPSKFGCSDDEYKRYTELYTKQLADHEKLVNNVEGFVTECKSEFVMYGDINFNLRIFDKEIDLIIDAFNFINSRKPHFMLAWNMRFDIQYLIERIKILGYDPISIIPHSDFEHPRCRYIIDKKYELASETDYLDCSSYTWYMCQMRTYGSIRKSQSKLRSLKLNYIGDLVLSDNKVEYPSNTDIKRFPYVDWRLFIKYNIKDVLLQVGIERASNDIETVYYKSQSNLTPYAKIFKETYLIRNVRELYFNLDGWVQGNNLNRIRMNTENDNSAFYNTTDVDTEELEASFKGAIMSEPSMNDNVGVSIFGKRSNCLFNNSMDYDMGAFYPTIKIISNMDPITLLYKASFVNNEFTSSELTNRSLNQTYEEYDKNNVKKSVDFTGEAVNAYVADNILTFGHSYLNLPLVTDMARSILNDK